MPAVLQLGAGRAAADTGAARVDAPAVSPSAVTLGTVTAADWRALDQLVQSWWDPDLRTMQEADLAFTRMTSPFNDGGRWFHAAHGERE